MNANITIQHEGYGRNVVINNTPWGLLPQLSESDTRLEFIDFQYYLFKTYDHIEILGYEFMITKMSKNNTTLISMYQNENDEEEIETKDKKK